MNAPQRFVWLALLLILAISMSPCIHAQGRGAYAAGINYPAGPPTAPSNTGYWLGGISPLDIHYGNFFTGDANLDVVVAASCAATAIATCPGSGSALVVYRGNGDGTFQSPVISGANIPPSLRSIVVGDFNNDGVLDIAAAADCLSTQDCSAGTITVLLGNGDGTFTQSSQYAMNGVVGQAGTLAVGDFNGDGKLDLAIGMECYNIPLNCSTGVVNIYLGNGDGTLGTPTPYSTVGNSPLFPIVGDFNNDGKLDVIAGSSIAPGDNSHGSLTVLLGRGDGTFAEFVTTLTIGFSLSSLASADFNSDGKLDLAISTYPPSLQFLSGNGDGTFQSPVAVSSNSGYSVTDVMAIAVADLNGDSKPDVIMSGTLAGNNGVQLFLNDGTGNFTGGPTYGLGGWEFAPFVAQDFNGDGKVDIVMASMFSENPGFNNHNPEGTLSVLLGNGNGTMQGATVITPNQLDSQTSSTITADVNGDGIPDLIQTDSSYGGQGAVIVSLGIGNGNYGSPTVYLTGSASSNWVAAGDFNGDGKLDLAVAGNCSDSTCTQGGVAILLGNGDGTFQTPIVYGAGVPASLEVVTGDFNSDGKLDVALMNQDQPPSISVLLGNGDGTLQQAVVTNISSDVSSNYSIAAGDFNGDGFTDLASLSESSSGDYIGLIGIYLSNGDGTLTQKGSTFSSGGTAFANGMSIAVADVNRDGILDIVVANACQLLDSACAYGSLATFIGIGDGTFNSGPLQTVPDGNFYSLLLTDVNGDGILDAIATNLTGVAEFKGNGDGSFQTPTIYAGISTGGQNMTLAMADLNIIQSGLTNGSTAVLVNEAGTYLVSTSSINPASQGETVRLTTSVSPSFLTGKTPSGSIYYFDGITNLGSAALLEGSASLNVTGLSPGVHTITPYYSGDTNFNAHSGTPVLQVVTSSVAPPGIYSPVSGSTLPGISETFSWIEYPGATAYWLDLGSTEGSNTYLDSGSLSSSTLSYSVSSLPTNGSTVWARWYYNVSGAWSYIDYSYTAFGGVPGGDSIATMSSPPPNSMLTGSSVTFSWNAGVGESQYWLDVGTSGFANKYYSASQGLDTSVTVNGLPTDGSTIIVTLYTEIAGIWYNNAYTYTAASNALAVMQSPTPGTMLSGSSVAFTWSAGSGATAYYLDIGSSVGGNQYYSQNEGTNTTATAGGLPTGAGITVYVTLYSLVGGTWQSNAYTYQAYNPATTAAVMSSPMPGSTFTGSSEMFSWNPVAGAQAYYLDIGTSMGGNQIYSVNQGTNTSVTVSTLPTDGSQVYVTLYTELGGTWYNNQYNYTAVTASLAVITAPSPGSPLTGTSQTFTWSTGTGPTQYSLDVGSSVGGNQYYSQNQGTGTSATVSGLPVDGSTVYVTLYSLVGGTWESNGYTFTAAQPASITSASVTGGVGTFNWNAGISVTNYYLDLGSTPGGNDLYSASQGTNQTVQVSGLPQSGTIYITLYSLIGGTYYNTQTTTPGD